jgi:hypothetical protein
MSIAILSILVGLVLLVRSADRFMLEGGILLLVFGAYNTWLVLDVAASAR